MILNSEDLGTLHADAIKENLGDISLGCKGDRRVAVKSMRGGSRDILR